MHTFISYLPKRTLISSYSSWIGSKNLLHSDRCVTFCGLTHWKSLATSYQMNTSLITQFEAARTFTGQYICLCCVLFLISGDV